MNHTTCIICKSHAIQPLADYKKYYLCQCTSCSFVFTQKIPTPDELVAHYDGYGRNDYLSPITIKRYHEILDKMEPFRKSNRLLDVGCGIGYFLEVAKERGWEVYGTEYTDLAVEICRKKGITMQQGPLSAAQFDLESFDVITSFEVIEHINNPLEEVALFHGYLRKGGLMYVTTPNFNSLLRYRLKSNYDVICYPEHLSYYTPKTLNQVFTQHGFTKQKIETTGISLSRLKNGTSGVSQQVISPTSTDEKLRISMEEKWHLQVAKKVANHTLTFFGVGDALKGWFIKR